MIKGIFLIIFDEKNIKVYTFSDLIMLFSKAIFPIINYNKIIYSLNQICEILKEQFEKIPVFRLSHNTFLDPPFITPL